MSQVEIQNDINAMVSEDGLHQAAQTVLQAHAQTDAALTIVLSDDDTVRALNHQHRGVDAATDVLSFPADPLPPELQGDDTLYLGDLIIAYPYASAQAKRLEHNLDDSLALLVVHGTLHLLGYDHDTRANRDIMWSKQAAALSQLGIDDAIVPVLEDSDHV